MSKIKLNNVRLSFASVFKKAVFQGTETKYEGTFLLDKEGHAKDIERVNAAINEMIESELDGIKLKADKICLKDGDLEDYDGYENCMSLKASNNARPTVIDKDKSPLVEDDGKVYSGCYVNVVIELWPQSNNWGKRINANLLGLQFVADGEAFGSGAKTASDDDFDFIDDDDDDDDVGF